MIICHNLYVDGSWDLKTDEGGWSVIQLDEDENGNLTIPFLSCGRGRGHSMTNNQMELFAALQAGKYAKNNDGLYHIYCDSRYTVCSINDWIPRWVTNHWKKTGTNKQVKNLGLMKKLHKIFHDDFFNADIQKNGCCS